ncbi:MAG: heavy metal translocating P-type ATPase [Anaerolineae bacterium]
MNAAISTVEPREETTSTPKWMTQAWLEPRLVVVTLFAILASLIEERLGASEGVILGLNVISYVAGGTFGLIGALKSLRERKLDVDLLMILAAVGAAIIGDWHEGAILLFLFSLSNVLQDYAIGRSRQAIKGLLKLYPTEAKVKRDGQTIVVKSEAIRPGDIVLIEPGERIPVDGIVRAGRSAVDQAPITGESIPVDKVVGDKVFAGTLNQQGALDVEAAGAANDTVLARVIKMVEEAQDSKAPTERFLDRFEQIYATAILAAVGLFIVVPPALGLIDFESNFYRAMVLMTVASPCALVISTPASFISAIASAARGGVLFKGGAYLEGLAAIKAITFDKTGTLTIGKPALTDVIAYNGTSDAELLRLAATAEARSEHPLAKAIVQSAVDRGITIAEVNDFEAFAGRGIYALVTGDGGGAIHIGSPGFLSQSSPIPPELDVRREEMEGQGKTVMGVKRSGEWIGLIALADQLRPTSKQIVNELQAAGVKVAILTGDNPRAAKWIGQQVGVDQVHAELMPDDKVTVVRRIQEEIGQVAMVGDGVNDAPALAVADIGIAMGAAGSDVALETADLVLMGDRLELIPYAISLSEGAPRRLAEPHLRHRRDRRAHHQFVPDQSAAAARCVGGMKAAP